jgi:hypothetical protein
MKIVESETKRKRNDARLAQGNKDTKNTTLTALSSDPSSHVLAPVEVSEISPSSRSSSPTHYDEDADLDESNHQVDEDTIGEDDSGSASPSSLSETEDDGNQFRCHHK